MAAYRKVSSKYKNALRELAQWRNHFG
jgi:hypothetical protein